MSPSVGTVYFCIVAGVWRFVTVADAYRAGVGNLHFNTLRIVCANRSGRSEFLNEPWNTSVQCVVSVAVARGTRLSLRDL